MTTLYELSGAWQLLENLEADTGDFGKALEEIQEAFSQKAENIAKLVRNLEAEADAYKAEADRLNAAGTARRNKAASLKDYLRRNMEELDIDRLEAGLFKLALQDSPPACEIINEEEVPEDYRELYTMWRYHRKAIMEHFKATEEQLPGTLVTQSKHLRIRP